ncbi:MAG: phage integrase SAM-like domain-containing protein, partial [Muribaculaceae bacterium]|nr:phage integrase SAM-like domain-containing protein [Muribaculaceae bacterium]
MATIKVKFRPSSVATQPGTIFYQIIHERKSRQLPTDYHIFPYEWDSRRSMVISSHDSPRHSFILSIRERIRWDMERIAKAIKALEKNDFSYSADEIIEEFLRYAHEMSLFNYMEKLIIKLKQTGKIRTSETYTSTLNSFKKFRDFEDIMLDSLSSDLMECYEAWLKRNGVSLNTVSFYTRILRAVYNRAVEEGLIENRAPFRRVYTG